MIVSQSFHGAQKAGPACEAAGAHVPGERAGGDRGGLYSSHAMPPMIADQKASMAMLMLV